MLASVLLTGAGRRVPAVPDPGKGVITLTTVRRSTGMAMTQALAVHADVVCHVEVDNTECSAIARARQIAKAVVRH